MLRSAVRNSSRLGARALARSGATAGAAKVATPALFGGARHLHLTRPSFALSANDAELVSTLKREIELESEQDEESQKASEEEGAVVKKFLADSGFKVVAQPGSDLIELVKNDGGEIVHVYFSLFDIAGEEAYENEEENMEAEEQEEEADYGDEMETPIRAKVVLEKTATNKALAIETTIHDDLFLIQYMQPHKDAKLALENSAEAEHKRRQEYQGPVYSTLDPNVQSAIERSLESRGVNSEMASFIVEYVGQRENQEYISWLKQVADVVAEE